MFSKVDNYTIFKVLRIFYGNFPSSLQRQILLLIQLGKILKLLPLCFELLRLTCKNLPSVSICLLSPSPVQATANMKELMLQSPRISQQKLGDKRIVVWNSVIRYSKEMTVNMRKDFNWNSTKFKLSYFFLYVFLDILVVIYQNKNVQLGLNIKLIKLMIIR